MSNRRYWDKLAVPPKTALKPIVAGRLKGKSDINPQWRMQVMTETFGPVGIGWTYSIDKLWTEPGSDGQVCAFAIVTVRVKDGEVWSEPVQGVGGAMLVEKERSGLYTSDEAFKMATTDALSVALKAFGVAAEVYLGNLDGSKYGRQPQSDAPPISQNRFVTREQLANIEALIAEVKADEAKFCDWLRKEYGIDFKTLADLPAQHYAHAIHGLEAKRKTA